MLMNPPLADLCPTTRSGIPSPSVSPDAIDTGCDPATLAAAGPVGCTPSDWLSCSQILGPLGTICCCANNWLATPLKTSRRTIAIVSWTLEKIWVETGRQADKELLVTASNSLHNAI